MVVFISFSFPSRYNNITFADFVSRGCKTSFDFSGLNDSIITGISLVNVQTADSAVGGACSFATGTCSGGTNHCPKCLTPA